MPKSIVGIDITATRLVAAEVANPDSKRPSLVKAAAVALDEGVARDGEVIDGAAVTAAIRELWSLAKFGSKRVVLGVGNQRVLVRDHTVDQMTPDQLRQALPFQVADILPVPVTETILDFYPVELVEGSAPQQVNGLLVAALKEGVEADVDALEAARLKVAGVDLSPFAILRALRAGDTLTGTHTIVAFGPRTTFLVVAQDGIPRFVRIVAAGAENITDSVMSVTGWNHDQATQAKQQLGILHGNDPKYGQASNAVLQAVTEILGSIRSTNNFYLSNRDDAEIESVILLGSETALPGLVDAVREFVGLPATVGDPLAAVRRPKHLKLLGALAGSEADLAIPVGLALGGK